MTVQLPAATGRGPLVVVAVAVAAFTAGMGFQPAFAGDRLLPTIAASTVAPALLAVVLGRSRCPFWLATLASAAAWWVLAACLPWTAPHPGSFRTVGRAVLDGVGPLLEWLPPAPDRPGLLVVPSLLAWLAAAVGVELALRGAPGALPAVPAWFGWLFATVFAVPASKVHVATAAVLLVLTVAVARVIRLTVAVAAAVLTAGAVVLGLGAATAAVPDSRPVPAAQSLFPARVVADDVLGDYDRWRSQTASPLFDIDGPALGSADGRWRLAELADLDRGRWVTAAGFGRTATAAGAGPRDRTVDVRELGSVFLPTLGTLTEVRTSDGLLVAPGTTMIARSRRDESVSYTVRLGTPAGGTGPYGAVPDGCGPVAGELARLSALPDRAGVTDAAADAAAGRLAAGLGPAATTVAGGEAERREPYGCPALSRAVRDRHSTDVQRVLAYVLAARAHRIPARPVVGFADLGTAERRTITGADARIWAEVYLGGRWRSVVVPTAGSRVEQPPPAPRPSVDPTPVPPTPPGRSLFERRPHGWLLLLAAILLAALATLGARWWWWWRRRRGPVAPSRLGPPDEQVLAAWRDTVEHLGRAGDPVPTGATPREVVGLAGPRLDPSARDGLALLAHDVVGTRYAGAIADENTATRAWRWRDRIARALAEPIGPDNQKNGE